MNNSENMDNFSGSNYSFDLYSTLKDVLVRWRTILLVGLLVSMAFFVYATETYTPQYATSATMLVQSKNDADNPASSLSEANRLAVVLKTVLDSEQLKGMVAKSVGENVFPGNLSCAIVDKTNIITFTVTSDSPLKSYILIEKVLESYPTFTNAVASSVVLQTLEPPIVPVAPINGSNASFLMVAGF
ncbi:MAG: Wzz/FepE/Etk N-terminal domain-containing protein, partial [Acutalibacteraceae bacterium]|nr:Wzz/FepE/Etk N-terminal domain-containing protein [Acutalibacteraceae bacterium]